MSYLKMAKMALEAMKAAGDLPRTTLCPTPDHVPADKQHPASPPERILTCFECTHFRPAATSPNPTQAWGLCNKRGRGRYGCAMACEAVLIEGGENVREPKH